MAMLVSEQQYGGVQGKANAGFVRTVWLLRCPDVLEVSRPEDLPVVGRPGTVSKAGLLVKAGAQLTRLSPPPRSAFFEQTPSQERAGTIYAVTLTVTLPRPSDTQLLFLSQNVRWVAYWLDGNSAGWIAGTPHNGLRLSPAPRQGEQNALTLQLTGRFAHSVWQLESTDAAELFPDGEFDLSFDASFY